jgi:hypothetical protein
MDSCRSIRFIATLFLSMALSAPAHAVAVRLIPNLTSITFYERTGGGAPTPFTFPINSPQLTTRLSDPLDASNHDIPGAATEFYDVFYSNADGTFNLNGQYLTIEGVFLQGLPEGGGLNLAEISLNFASAPPEFGSFVASFVALGDNAIPGDVVRAIDGDLQTHTTMGNTVGQTQRLRVTLGFQSASQPSAPAASIPTLSEWGLIMLIAAIATVVWFTIRSRTAG